MAALLSDTRARENKHALVGIQHTFVACISFPFAAGLVPHGHHSFMRGFALASLLRLADPGIGFESVGAHALRPVSVEVQFRAEQEVD